MWVTYPELTSHVKKVLEACLVPSGCIDDGAELVAWGEAMGLGGLKDLYAHLPRLEQSEYPSIYIQRNTCIDGNRNSGLIISRLIFDEILCKQPSIQGEPIALTRCLPALSMMENVRRAAKRGCQAEIYIPADYPNVHVMTALNEDEIFAFTLKLSEVNQLLFEKGISCLFNISKNNQETKSRIKVLNNKTSAYFLTSKDIKIKEARLKNKGVYVDKWLWKVLDEKGKQALV
ncbi:DUF3726 domain-containing protein [Alkalicoccus halolimnae]|uniref:DUF3726 domain-containing protein n=1 Tax=Alkalicoccus halolimnae TaxID=1667239 RepID=A0A5C7FGL7_9BACI|nr:DUF3726 domain-containing protein [Alkalicoccus halolimnae]TXF85329.1 DUF3726 domain-containing protein [Alkalicoccus halolimnae]